MRLLKLEFDTVQYNFDARGGVIHCTKWIQRIDGTWHDEKHTEHPDTPELRELILALK